MLIHEGGVESEVGGSLKCDNAPDEGDDYLCL